MSRVLIVDDDLTMCTFLSTIIEGEQHEIRVEHRAEDAIHAVREFEPNLILLDIVMPGLDGTAVSTELETHPRYGRIPIVFITGMVTDKESKALGGRIAGRPLLVKPVLVGEVVDLLEKYLSRTPTA